jgi:hypothetical protein
MSFYTTEPQDVRTEMRLNAVLASYRGSVDGSEVLVADSWI